MKYLTVTENGFKYAVPAEVIAKNRANWYKDDTSFEEEFEYTMNNNFEISEWFSNNMNWEDVEAFATLIETPGHEVPQAGMSETEVVEFDKLEAVSSGNPVVDNVVFQKKYGFDSEPLNYDKLRFRMDLLKEEFGETMDAFKDCDAEEWVDGHIDLLVIALGNLHLAGIDINKAWSEVYRANMSKIRGVKPGREQSGGFDVIKPEGWVSPSHKDNHGKLGEIFSEN